MSYFISLYRYESTESKGVSITIPEELYKFRGYFGIYNDLHRNSDIER